MIELPITHRYLVRFHPRRVPHLFTDVLIIGSGIAGMRAALELAQDQQAGRRSLDGSGARSSLRPPETQPFDFVGQRRNLARGGRGIVEFADEAA